MPAFWFAKAPQAIEIQRCDKRPVCKKAKGHQHKRPAYESGVRHSNPFGRANENNDLADCGPTPKIARGRLWVGSQEISSGSSLMRVFSEPMREAKVLQRPRQRDLAMLVL
jgi:hypothetical protein